MDRSLVRVPCSSVRLERCASEEDRSLVPVSSAPPTRTGAEAEAAELLEERPLARSAPRSVVLAFELLERSMPDGSIVVGRVDRPYELLDASLEERVSEEERPSRSVRVTDDVWDEERSVVAPRCTPPIRTGLENEVPDWFCELDEPSSALAMVAPANRTPPANAAVPRDRLIHVCMGKTFRQCLFWLPQASDEVRREQY
ncbi:hypothetical protein [Intrasporangium sp. YIM S08009]|uniref:hypothetical protein n=1 Tax=Intrasporangium zincisolvens TaxID=3080018 RepID=UPI002B0570FD|nr:hypothetical protein [Intrasporangium sp. YIM S08009]